MTRNIAHQRSLIIPFQFIGQIAKKIRIFPLIVLLFSPISLWVLTEAIAPQLVRAYTARVDLNIVRMADESYETVLRRAEAVSRAAAQRSFDQDILATDVYVIVTVESYGAIAPVLALEVSRQQWRTHPDPQRWATYFKTARSLLLFDTKPAISTNIQPAPQGVGSRE
ncbi:hypothetical protein [Nodularia sphaerocarpa]|uniref:hypothetical protein n=1 Tax=Nodularia sphaerocarpa TaxID=137816 RepID=UPI001EFC010D|nr:hypothetical protein [Nodularia sphaerocarpa]MDB9372136.1 hypothetical protein [Nodularia sphaerocarpa CS-585]MDB9380564.1 hypothetical protein [Nodularia sphaerocarpa CS-585A2]ULP70850.1 hypothetical protein BDGGKGIB_00472 [Nodularia sphaerocarpa UHCC 0038]